MVKPTARSQLIEAAFALFHERGYEGTTVDDIAERAGVGRTTYFRAFRSKEAVIFPDHEAVLASVTSRLNQATPETAALAVVAGARLVLEHYLAEGELARSRYRLTSTVPALRQREIAGMQQYQRVFREFIHRWMSADEDGRLRAELMASAVVTAHNYVLRRWLRRLTDRPRAEFDEAMGRVLDLFEPPARTAGENGRRDPLARLPERTLSS